MLTIFASSFGIFSTTLIVSTFVSSFSSIKDFLSLHDVVDPGCVSKAGADRHLSVGRVSPRAVPLVAEQSAGSEYRVDLLRVLRVEGDHRHECQVGARLALIAREVPGIEALELLTALAAERSLDDFLISHRRHSVERLRLAHGDSSTEKAFGDLGGLCVVVEGLASSGDDVAGYAAATLGVIHLEPDLVVSLHAPFREFSLEEDVNAMSGAASLGVGPRELGEQLCRQRG